MPLAASETAIYRPKSRRGPLVQIWLFEFIFFSFALIFAMMRALDGSFRTRLGLVPEPTAKDEQERA